ncbi:MAG: hypothetical protein KatS3mg003_0248 [Candidatus Nitrosocaldaceae archaeon]|nr:MAG: hypothetical protein KatS3mg003_0248 [Candidatus Nitrosocaldaceae archaeon]
MNNLFIILIYSASLRLVRADMNRGNIAWSLGIMAILLTSTVAMVTPIQVKAQNATITSSADRFFGPSLVKITVNAPDDNDDDNDFDTADIEIDIEDDNGNTLIDSQQFILNETGKNTGRFELFIAAHTDANPKNPSTGATIVRIYEGGDIDLALDEGYEITIRHTNTGVEKTIVYDNTNADFSLDRTTAGDGNVITLTIEDQDANLDPTGIDKFTADGIITATLPLDLTGLVFEETGQNTNEFELDITVNNELTVDDFPNSVDLTLIDHDVYHQTTDTYPDGTAVGNGVGNPPFSVPDDTNREITRSVDLENTDGQIELTEDLTIGNGLMIKIIDADRNIRTGDGDTLPAGSIEINGQVLNIDFDEIGDNTGEFVPDLTNNRIPIKVVNDNGVNENIKIVGNEIQVDASDIAAEPDITITYIDPAGDPEGQEEFSITREIQHFEATIEADKDTVTVAGKIEITIRDGDLNTDSTKRDSHTVSFNINADGDAIGKIANGLGELTISITDKPIDSIPSIVFSEVDEDGNAATNTGIFRGTISVDDIDVSPNELDDGDKINIDYEDFTEDPSITRSVDITISKAAPEVTLDRNSYPPSHKTIVHTENSKANDVEVGVNVVIHVDITDSSENTNANSEDTIILDENNFKLELLGPQNFVILPDKDKAENGDAIYRAGGDNEVEHVQFKPISDTSAEETGRDTGVFEVDIILPAKVGGRIIDDDYQIKVTYTASNGDDADDSASIRSTTATLSTDMIAYVLGNDIVLTINEPDWNADSESVDVINADISAIFVDARKQGTIQDTVSDADGNMGLDPDQLEETGENTGVFMITIENINENFVERSDKITFEYEDDTTDGAGGAETIEHTVNIVSGVPEIIFDKETYTPFDEVCVTIVDQSANIDPDDRDELFKVEVEVGEFKDVFKSDTNSFVETASDSGIFMLEEDECIQLDASLWDNGNTSENDGVLPAARDKAVRVTYETSTGDVELSKSALIVFNDASISFDKNSYNIGERAVITVVDPDLNTNPDIEDTISIDVWSTSDRAGVDVTLRETDEKTGVFTGEVLLSSDVSSGTRLHVSEGDTITARYTDRTLPDPADYDEETDATISLDTQRLDATATIGISKFSIERAPASEPEFVDELGTAFAEITVGQQVLVSSKVTNNQTISQDFIHIVKVTDEDGNVVMLSFTQGTLNPNEERTNAFSWIPEKPGTYTVEILVWESFENPIPLSPKITETVEVM